MQAEYSREKLEKLSLAELEQIIRSQPLDDLDPDTWTSVMEEYLCRREAPKPDANAAFAEFCERYSGSEPVFAVEEKITVSPPGVRRGLHPAADGGLPPPGRHRRLGAPLPHDGPAF